MASTNKHLVKEPRLDRSLTLNFHGDWGMANFHRICSWLSQEFCDRSGPHSQVAIWNNIPSSGGIEAVTDVFQGKVQLALATPAQTITRALTGEGIFAPYGPMPSIRSLGVLPQNDRLVLAIHPKYGISSLDELRAKKPALRIAVSTDDGSNFIGYTATAYMKAIGLDDAVLESWGATCIRAHRPEQTIEFVERGEADAVLQEAVMTPWWANIVENLGFVPIPADSEAIRKFEEANPGLSNTKIGPLPAGFWSCLKEPLPALDFSDFAVLVRDDLPEDVAYLLTWCLVETRQGIENQYRHLPAHRSPLSYPITPANMVKSAVPLHPGAERYYREAGLL